MSTQRPYTDAEWSELQTENALLREAARELLQEAPDALAAAHAQIESLAAGIEEARQHYRVQLAELGQRCNALEKERDEARLQVTRANHENASCSMLAARCNALERERDAALSRFETLQATIKGTRHDLTTAHAWATSAGSQYAPAVALKISQVLKVLGLDE